MAKRERGTGRVYQQKGCKLYYIQYYKNGRRIREATGLNDERAAKRKLQQRLQQISAGVFVGVQVERIKVNELWDAFKREQDINKRKRPKVPKTRWIKHLEPYFGYMKVVDVGTDALNQYVDERMKEGAANATINREIAVLRRMFRLGYSANPPKVMRLPTFPKLKEDNVRLGFLESEQYQKLAAVATELWIRAMLEIYFTYGWRKKEVMGMKVKHADFVDRLIRLDIGTTKNKEGRDAPMTPEIYALLSECAHGKKPDDALFTRSNGKPVRDFRTSWRNLCVAAGIGAMICRLCGEPAVTKCESCKCSDLKYEGRIVHDMRRTAARNLRRAGAAEGIIMKIGGWKTRSVFERYNIVDQRDKREAMQKLEIARKTDFGHNSDIIEPKQAPEVEPPTTQQVN